MHPSDPTADVAVIHVAPNLESDTVAIAEQHLGLPERINEQNIGIGDEVFAVGLFTETQNETRNLPIIRHGNIAMMPTQPIQTELGYADMYLVEARSLGGLSGSPVFAHNTLIQKVKLANGSDSVMLSNGPGTTLLGLAHGHWDIRESEINKPSFTHDRKHGVNYGMALVVPAIKIYETLYHPGLVATRKDVEKELLNQSPPRTDLANSKTG